MVRQGESVMTVMAHLPMIRRTEKLRVLRELLNERKIVFLSAFFYSGKTVLLDQLCESWSGETLRYRSAVDDWADFRSRIREKKDALIVIDSIDSPSGDMSAELAPLLSGLEERQRAVVAAPVSLRCGEQISYSSTGRRSFSSFWNTASGCFPPTCG